MFDKLMCCFKIVESFTFFTFGCLLLYFIRQLYAIEYLLFHFSHSLSKIEKQQPEKFNKNGNDDGRAKLLLNSFSLT